MRPRGREEGGGTGETRVNKNNNKNNNNKKRTMTRMTSGCRKAGDKRRHMTRP